MAFVKLDCGMLDSTTWFDKDARDIFITALLMAIPREFDDPVIEIELDSLDLTGWKVPAGWYGFVSAASRGIIARCGIDEKTGMAALKRLGAPESESRSQKNNGRRMVRVDGGFLILNFDAYREKDHTSAERQRRYRAKKKAERYGVTSRNDTSRPRNVTQAEAEAEAEAYIKTKTTRPCVRFDDFWKVYPKKRNRKGVLEIWKRRELDKVADKLIADVKNRTLNDERWVAGYVPDPTTYLNQDRWDDELNDTRGKDNGADHQKHDSFDAIYDRNLKRAGLDEKGGESLDANGRPVR